MQAGSVLETRLKKLGVAAISVIFQKNEEL